MKKSILLYVLVLSSLTLFAQQRTELGITHTRAGQMFGSVGNYYEDEINQRSWAISYAVPINDRWTWLTRASYHQMKLSEYHRLWLAFKPTSADHYWGLQSRYFASADLQMRWRALRIWRFDLSARAGLGLMTSLPDKERDFYEQYGVNRREYRTDFLMYKLVGTDLRFWICKQLGFDLGISRRRFSKEPQLDKLSKSTWVSSAGLVWAL